MNNYSYVTYLTDDTYAYGICLLVESMKKVNTKYPLHVLITEEVSAPTIEILNQLGVSYELVDIIHTPDNIFQRNLQYSSSIATTWRNCWTQFKVFDLVQFDKIIFLDADVMFLQNLDELFKKPHMTAALDGEYFDLWPDWPHLNTGLMVIKPSHEEYNNLINFANNLKLEDLPDQIVANQEVINLYYKDWPQLQHLHLDKYYNIFAPYILEDQLDDIKEKAKFIHFIGRKPWNFWVRMPQELYSEYFYEQGKQIVENRIKTLDWDKIHEKVTVTVYGICKNEIKSVNNYLQSFGIADYVCLLDTGSTDGTWEYLQKAQQQSPNLIIAQELITPWRFDTARNKSMELIPKDTTVYFMADLDEVIKEKDWVTKIRNSWTPLFDRGIYTYNREVKENDVVVKQMNEFRIHSKDWYKWINIVHEALINHKGNKQFYIETCTPIDITVWHYPTKEQETNYMELCEQDLQEKPEDWVMRLQLAIEYEIRSMWDKAYEHFYYIITHNNTLQNYELARCYFGIGRIYTIKKAIAKALSYFQEGRLVEPSFADNYLAAAEIYYNSKKYQITIDLIKSCLSNCKQANWCSIFDAQSYYPYILLGMSYYFLGQREQALAYLTIGYFKNADDEIYNLKKQIATEIVNSWHDIGRNDLSLS